jgi:DNA-binding response OmpR family regulator
MRILLVEDDSKIATMVSRLLKTNGYAVDIADNGIDGEEYASVNQYDVIILDIMLPRQDGLVTCANLRKAEILTPVLMLTALGGVDDRITGLDTGADDYLSKPFHSGELLARVRSLARRRSDARSAVIEKFGVRVDISTHRCSRKGVEIQLSAKEFSLLELFITHPDRVISRETISEHLWDMNFDLQSNVIESFIKFLRQKIDKPFSTPLIHTVRGVGYRFTDSP